MKTYEQLQTENDNLREEIKELERELRSAYREMNDLENALRFSHMEDGY